MSRKQRRKQRRKNKQAKQLTNQVQVHEPVSMAAEEPIAPDRFVFVNEIAERFGLEPAAIRQWRRQGKIKLRKVFGTSGWYGMPESELIKFINGEGEV